GFTQILGYTILPHLKDAADTRNHHLLQQKEKQTESNRQPQKLRRKGRGIERRKTGLGVQFDADLGNQLGCILHLGFRSRFRPLRECRRRKHGLPLSREGRPRKAASHVQIADQTANSSSSATSSEKMPSASVTAKPKIRRPNWPSAADGLRSAPERYCANRLPTPTAARPVPTAAMPAPIIFAASASIFMLL